MGFAKAFGYGHITQLSHSISRPAGVLWFVTAMLFLVAAALYLLRKEWWLIGFPAALLSQLLIISVWQDARFGTIANCLVLAVGLVSLADWTFDRKVAKEVTALLAVNKGNAITVTPEMLAPLPPVVQKWLLRSGAVGKELIHTVRLKQKGEMLTKPGGRWMDFEATQYVVVDQPGFNWQTKVQAMPGVFLSGRDKYANGQGEMLIKLLSLKEVVHAGGTEQMNQGTLLRFLGETCWFPTAALSDYIKWEPLDSRSARATMTYRGVTATGDFFFNEEGDVTGFEAMRYGDFNGKTSLEKWHIENKSHREFEGIRIPYQNEVTWKLKTGDFTWLKLELTEVQYNRAAMFE
ncbi:hypothetical protein GCM10023188_30660 [Pontibacter saemangeumensis]|uniref:DUF4131 domain-containing protein n=2 Tax=Pontibacter saemangeumensis TaxID=1084525 RepID=A0ABP8LW34_9BACT